MGSKITLLGISSVLLLGCAMIGPIMSQVETPEYQILSKKESIETRLYQDMVIAQVTIEGTRKDSIGKGFQLLADYIFGNNQTDVNVTMTTPVEQEQSTKIAMTAPVQQVEEASGLWKISFVMPSKYTKETLPKPNNTKVQLIEIPAKKFIAITFSGRNTDDNIQKHKQKLIHYITKHNIQIMGSAKYAFYNPPWTLPMFRRNEVMFEIK